MSDKISVIKRDGTSETYDPAKINKVLQWASRGIKNVSFETVGMNTHINIFDGISSKNIHSALIESAASLISVDNPNYQYVASRLQNYQLRKEVWGGKNAPRLYDFTVKNIEVNKVYEPDLVNWYSRKEWDKLDDYIDHDRDFSFTYAGIKQLCDKYLIQNRFSKEIYETPQFAYMLIAMTFFKNYKENRIKYVKKAYDYFSTHKINLPTPIMAGVRSTLKSYASCALFTVDDTLASIFGNNTAIGFATGNRYGIGLNVSRIRATNAPVRGGEIMHTGPIPYLKMYESTVKSCQQNGLRGGGATVNVAWFHHDIEEILVLKNNAGTDDNRVRKLDYCIGLDKVFYQRFLEDTEVSLFSYHEVPELWNSFGLENFEEVYKACEARTDLKFKKVVKARDLMTQLSKERIETGRIYVLNVDHVNTHGSWTEQVDTTNLCVEITHPLIPIQDYNDPDGEIGVCILAAVNLLETKEEEMADVTDVIVRILDALISHQNYFTKAAENFATKRRSLGVGVTNLAAYLAVNKLKYTDEGAPNAVSKVIESLSYNLINASVDLAVEFGPCEKFHLTKFSQGILPVDTYKDTIDEFVTEKLHKDWKALRKRILKHGMRNSTLTAMMPVESSSVIQSSTNGMEPPRSLISSKKSKAGVIPVVVPHVEKCKDDYTLAFGMKNNDGYLRVVAAVQKFVDMSMSTNLYYNVQDYPIFDEKTNSTKYEIPQDVLITDILKAYSYGIKSLYYSNTYDGDTQSAIDEKNQTPAEGPHQTAEAAVWTPDAEDKSGCAGGACTL